jgi:hypothetical protein
MKHLSISFFFVISLLALNVQLNAQQAIPAAGGNASSAGGSVSFTVGQIFYSNFSAPEGSVSQGVQQPYEISVISAIEEVDDINLRFSVFPNPASDFLVLEMEKEWSLPRILFLYDINGKLLQNVKIINHQTRLDISRYKPAVYFLKVVEGKKELKVFRIVKN